MKIWLIQANEPIPYIDNKQRAFRTGMLADELNKRNHKIIWFSSTFDHYTKTQRFKSNKTISIGENFLIKMMWANSYKKNISVKRIINHKYMALNFRKMISNIEKPDLIYCSFPTIELAYEAIKYGQINSVKVIIDIRDLWPDIFFQNLKFPLNYFVLPYQFLMNEKTKKIFTKAYGLNATSSEALRWGLDKIKREQSNTDYSYFIGYKKNENKEMNVSQLNYDIPFIGTIGNQINYHLIYEVARLAQQEEIPINILICGDGPRIVDFKNIVNGITNIQFLGWIDSEKINYILKQSFLGIVPYNDTFDFQVGVGNKFGENLSFSLPVIVTCKGEMEKLVNQYQCGISSSNPYEIISYIKKMIKNNDLYLTTRKNAKLLFQEKLESEKIYVELANYLEHIVGEEV